MKLKLPLAVGVPVIVQSALRAVPAGSAPDASVVPQLYGAVPPLVFSRTPDSALPRAPLPVRLMTRVGLLTGTVTVAGAEVPPAFVAVKVKLSLPRKPVGGV